MKKLIIYTSQNLLSDLLCGLAGGVDAAVVHNVAGQGLAGASCEGVALVSLQAVAVLDALRRVPLADGVRTAEDDTAFPSRHTAIVDVPLEVPLAATNPIIA